MGSFDICTVVRRERGREEGRDEKREDKREEKREERAEYAQCSFHLTDAPSLAQDSYDSDDNDDDNDGSSDGGNKSTRTNGDRINGDRINGDHQSSCGKDTPCYMWSLVGGKVTNYTH